MFILLQTTTTIKNLCGMQLFLTLYNGYVFRSSHPYVKSVYRLTQITQSRVLYVSMHITNEQPFSYKHKQPTQSLSLPKIETYTLFY